MTGERENYLPPCPEDISGREEGLRRDSQTLVSRLSPRKRQVFERVAEGCSVRSISEELGLNQRTVEVYQANVLQKFGASAIAEIVWVAIYAGINRSY